MNGRLAFRDAWRSIRRPRICECDVVRSGGGIARKKPSIAEKTADDSEDKPEDVGKYDGGKIDTGDMGSDVSSDMADVGEPKLVRRMPTFVDRGFFDSGSD